MSVLVLFATAFLTFTLAGNLYQLMDIELWRPDFMVIWVFFAARTWRGPFASLLAILLACLFSAFTFGATFLYILLALILTGSTRFLMRLINLTHPVFAALYCFATVLGIQHFYVLLTQLIHHQTVLDAPGYGTRILVIAAATALVSPVFLWILQHLHNRALATSRDDAYMLH